MKVHHIILILLFLGLTFAVDINNCQAMSEAGGSSTVGIAAAELTVATGESEVPWYIIWLPVLKLHFNVWILIAIGFSLGVLGRFFGVGGICFLTPALNVFGFPIPTAIGTDLAQMTVKACIRLAKGGWRAQVEIKLVVLMIIGMVAGVELGARTVIWLADLNKAGIVIRVVYLAGLLGLGLFMIKEYRRVTGMRHDETFSDQGWLPPLDEGGTAVSRRLQAMRFPPVVHLSASGVRVSFWIIIGIAIITGWLFGLLGVIGTFLPLPAMIYVIGLPAATALGTDLLCTVFSGGYGSITYGLKGHVEIIAVLWILVGTLVGTQTCSRAARYVKGPGIRLLYAVTTIMVGLSLVLKQFNVIVPARVVLLAALLAPSGIIVFRMLKGYIRDRLE